MRKSICDTAVTSHLSSALAHFKVQKPKILSSLGPCGHWHLELEPSHTSSEKRNVVTALKRLEILFFFLIYMAANQSGTECEEITTGVLRFKCQ